VDNHIYRGLINSIQIDVAILENYGVVYTQNYDVYPFNFAWQRIW